MISGAALGLCIVLVRRHLPESPRWLLLHGRIAEAATTVARIETAVHRAAVTTDAASVPAEVEMTVLGNVGFETRAVVIVGRGVG